MPNRRRRQASLKRRHPRFTPRPRVLVVCEGDVTEPSYLRELFRRAQNRIVVDIDARAGVPKTVVERAVTLKRAAELEARRQRDPFLRYDEVWAVFDVDAHPNLADALQQARANNIGLAVSNPCFELWLLLHFRAQNAHIERAEARTACREHMPGYNKLAPIEQLYPLYEQAIERAKALEKWQRGCDRVGGNPSTGVHHLIERIQELAREAVVL